MSSVSLYLCGHSCEWNLCESHSRITQHKTSKLWSCLIPRPIAEIQLFLIEAEVPQDATHHTVIVINLGITVTKLEIHITHFWHPQALWKDELYTSKYNHIIFLFLPGLDFCFAICPWRGSVAVEPGITVLSSKSDSGIVAQPPSWKWKNLNGVLM